MHGFIILPFYVYKIVFPYLICVLLNMSGFEYVFMCMYCCLASFVNCLFISVVYFSVGFFFFISVIFISVIYSQSVTHLLTLWWLSLNGELWFYYCNICHSSWFVLWEYCVRNCSLRQDDEDVLLYNLLLALYFSFAFYILVFSITTSGVHIWRLCEVRIQLHFFHRVYKFSITVR